ncbi:SPFH domain-containing protein [Kribbella sp. NBC_01245]|uniref:SPFH domain-containing protein n=1 Tax=Kribbella sp. NBC_01245 TaxID=2903578 RepID=UPI002E29F67A|nr:SPFH domain-containing protein [Kribbella sp. NBC_01245]
MLTAIVVLVLLVLVLVAASITRVPPNTVALVERLGKFQTALQPGLAFRIPFVDKVAHRVSLQPMVLRMPKIPLANNEGTWVEIEPVIHFQVIDAPKAVYEIANFHQGLEQVATIAARQVVGTLDEYGALAGRGRIRTAIAEALVQPATAWGLRIAEVDVPSVERAKLPSAPTS